MSNKITLITPPDFYENGNYSILFIGMTDQDQDLASKWLSKNNNYPDCNFYYYQGETNIEWLLYALNRSDAKYVNLDAGHEIINTLGSYILSKSNTYYMTTDVNLKQLINYINNSYVSNIEQFLEKIFNDQR